MPLKYKEILRILKDFSYQKFHQTWSHERWYYLEKFWVTVPHHDELVPKTAKSILNDIAKHHSVPVEDIIKKYNIKL